MAKNPAFQFYPADHTRDLGEHDLHIEGAWMRIQCTLWWSETPGKATKSLANWARVLRVGHKKSLSIIDYLLKKNIASGEVRGNQITIISRRMLRDEHLRQVRRDAGLLGGNPALKRNISGEDLDKQTLVKQKPTPSSSSSTSPSKKEAVVFPSDGETGTPSQEAKEGPEGFRAFWEAYPRKMGKAETQKAWCNLNPTESLRERIMHSLDRHRATEQWAKGVIPNPATFLNGKRWEDEIPGAIPAGSNPAAHDGPAPKRYIYDKDGTRRERLPDGTWRRVGDPPVEKPDPESAPPNLPEVIKGLSHAMPSRGSQG